MIARPHYLRLGICALALCALLPAACFETHTVAIGDGAVSGDGPGGTTPGGSGGRGGTTAAGSGGAANPAGTGGRGTNPGTGGVTTSPGTGGAVNVDPAPYADAMLLSSCSGPRGEILDGAWWSSVDAGSTIVPLALDGNPFTMSSGGYMGAGAHVTGTTAPGGYAVFGLNMQSGSVLYNASTYAGFSFYAKASTPMQIQVAVSEEDTDPMYGTCTALMTCYLYPTLSVAVGTTWTRYVVPFALMSSAPLPNGGRVFVSPSKIKHFHFAMPPGPFDFWADELYFIRAR